MIISGLVPENSGYHSFSHSAFKVNVESSEPEGDFVTYKAKVQGVYIKGKILLRPWSEFGHGLLSSQAQ